MKAEATEELLRIRRECSAPADEEPYVTAQSGVHRSEHHLSEIESSGSTDLAIEIQTLVEGQLKELALGAHLTANAAVEQLPERGNANHAGHTAMLEAVGQPIPIDGIEIDDARSTRERQQKTTSKLEGVVQRQNAEQSIRLTEREHSRDRGHERAKVAVAEHDALGDAGRARGVQDAREVVGLNVRGGQGRGGIWRRHG